jgi:hypothetical protein
MREIAIRWALVSSLVAILAACGGGGGGTSPSGGISGVAATGAPIANAPIFIKDSTGAEPAGQNQAAGVALVSTDANGAYTIPSSALAGLRGPFIIRVAGSKVLDSGDDASAILHAVVPSSDGVTANLTPLTEAATILTLRTDTATAFQSPQTSVASYTNEAAQNANTALLNALPLPSGLGSLNLVSGLLDAQPAADLSNPGVAKLHDMLLDTFEFSASQGQLILSDRNRPEDQLVGGPKIVISAATTSSVAASGGNMEGIKADGILDATKLQGFISRFNAQLRSGCSVPLLGTYNGTCTSVLSPANGVFSTAYKHTGMTSDKWLSAWVASPLDVEDLGDVTVSLRAAYRGTFMATPTQRVTRVALKFERPNGDFVVRTLLLADEGANITVYGNQKDYFLWARPRLTVNTDADDTYPFNPKYQVGVQFVLKHWFAGQANMILGAHIDGPGLPTANVRNYNGHTSGIEIFQRTDISAGCSSMAIDPKVYAEKNIRTWDAAWSAYKLSNYNRAVLYDGKVRWREGNLTCDPTFDMRRYYTATELGSLVLPKRGDVYHVTLYLDASKWGGAGQPALPPGAGTLVSNKVNADGDTISYYPLQVTETLRADAFAVPVGNGSISTALLPGITDATRQRLVTYTKGSDRLVEWSRNLVGWLEQDGSGNSVRTTFSNFMAGVFTSAKDQMSSADTGYSTFFNTQSPPAWLAPATRGFKDYREFFTTTASPPGHLVLDAAGVSSGRLDLDCGATATYKGATVRVRVRKVTNLQTGDSNDRLYEEVSCAVANAATGASGSWPALNRTPGNWYWVGTGNSAFFRNTNSGSTETIRYQYDVVRDRITFQSDKNTQVMANQLSRTLSWAQMMGKEKQGSQALCSSLEGAWGSRQAYVIFADMNGRQIKESREVSADFPGMSESDLGNAQLTLAGHYTSASSLASAIGGAPGYRPSLTRAIDISRPNYLTDPVYLPMRLDVSDYDLSWTSPENTYSWSPVSDNWHAQPGVIQPAYEKASSSATTCTRVTY